MYVAKQPALYLSLFGRQGFSVGKEIASVRISVYWSLNRTLKTPSCQSVDMIFRIPISFVEAT